jgi:hypothetical protein
MAKKKTTQVNKLSKKTTKSKSKKIPTPKVEGKEKKKRRISDYLILQSAISKYCGDRYERLMADPKISADEKKKIRKKCTKKEVSEIYQGLKTRFLTSKTKGLKINASELSLEIENKLSYKGKAILPFTLREFEWFLLVDMLYGADGFYFKPSDTLNFNCDMGGGDNMGVFSTDYGDLEDYYKEEMYSPLREYMEALQGENDSSVKPLFVFNEGLSDIENRIFWWDLNDGMGEAGSEDSKKEREEDLGDDFELTEEDIQEPKESGKKGKEKPKKEVLSEAVLVEREKTKQEQEKSKQQAMELLKLGLIDKDEFKKLTGL